MNGDGKVLGDPRWRKLLADPKGKGIVDKLIYRYEELNAKFGDRLPESIDELLDAGLRADCPVYLAKIAAMKDDEFPAGWSRAKMMDYAREHYRLDLKSTGDAVRDMRLDGAMQEALKIVMDPKRKSPIEGREELPDITISARDFEEGMPVVKFGADHVSDDRDDELVADLHKMRVRSLEKAKGYRLKRLDPSDPRGFYLGKLTKCCQSLDGNSKEVVKYGMTEIDSGFYVIEDERGRIVAQSWAWVSRDGKSVVLDSLEVVGEEVRGISDLMYSKLAEELKASGYENVYLGSGGATGEMPYEITIGQYMPLREGYAYSEGGRLYGDSVFVYDLSLSGSQGLLFFSLRNLTDSGNIVEFCKKFNKHERLLISMRDVILDYAYNKFDHEDYLKHLISSEKKVNSYILSYFIWRCTSEEKFSFVEKILDLEGLEKEVTPDYMRKAILEALDKKQTDLANRIFAFSDYFASFPSYDINYLVSCACNTRNYSFVTKIMNSKTDIDQDVVYDSFNTVCIRGNLDNVKNFLSCGREISADQLCIMMGSLLTMGRNLSLNKDKAAAIINSEREIDQDLLNNLCDKLISWNKFFFIEDILDSGRTLGDDTIKEIINHAAERGNVAIAKKALAKGVDMEEGDFEKLLSSEMAQRNLEALFSACAGGNKDNAVLFLHAVRKRDDLNFSEEFLAEQIAKTEDEELVEALRQHQGWRPYLYKMFCGGPKPAREEARKAVEVARAARDLIRSESGVDDKTGASTMRVPRRRNAIIR